jgi:hypothetical protein
MSFGAEFWAVSDTRGRFASLAIHVGVEVGLFFRWIMDILLLVLFLFVVVDLYVFRFAGAGGNHGALSSRITLELHCKANFLSLNISSVI